MSVLNHKFKFFFYIFLFFFLKFCIFPVYADYQNEYDFYLDYLSFDEYFNDESNIFRNDQSVKYWLEYIDNYIKENNVNNYDYSIIYTSNFTSKYIYVYLYPDEQVSLPARVYLSPVSGLYRGYVSYGNANNSVPSFRFISTTSAVNFESEFTNLTNCLKGLDYTKRFYSSSQDNRVDITSDSNVYFYEDSRLQNIIYTSSFKNSFIYESVNNSTYITRDLVIDGKIYKFGEYIPSYKEVVGEVSYIPYNDFYGLFGSLSNYSSDVLNFTIFSNSNLEQYNINNINFYTKSFEDNKISYNKLNCTYDIVSSVDSDSKTFKINNFICDNSPGVVYFNISFNNNIYVYNFKNNNTLVNLYVNDVINNNNYIVDTINNLTIDSQVLFSTNLTGTNVYYFYDENIYTFNSRIVNLLTLNATINRGLGRLNTSHLLPYNSGTFGKNTNTGFLVYNSILFSDNFSFSYIVNADSILISYSNNGIYSYYNNSGDIVTGIIINDYFGNSSVEIEEDVSNYFKIVDDFILSLNDNILSFKSQLANFYNLAPSEIKTILIVMFICNMTYITFKILSK